MSIRIISLAASCVLVLGLSAQNTDRDRGKQPQLAPGASPTTQESGEAVKETVSVRAVPVAAPVDPKSYPIGQEDILLIDVWKEQALTRGVEVRPDGKITMPLIGELQAAGLTPEKLKDDIIEALSKYINKPEVTVSVQAVRSRKYFITGEVNRPGAFPLVVPTTVMEALTNAGGFREFANLKNIRILRKNGTVLKFNYKDVVRGKNMQQNVQVENGDFIIVED